MNQQKWIGKLTLDIRCQLSFILSVTQPFLLFISSGQFEPIPVLVRPRTSQRSLTPFAHRKMRADSWGLYGHISSTWSRCFWLWLLFYQGSALQNTSGVQVTQCCRHNHLSVAPFICNIYSVSLFFRNGRSFFSIFGNFFLLFSFSDFLLLQCFFAHFRAS